MEYTKEALDDVARSVEVYRRDLLRIAMDKAAEEAGATEVRLDHVQAAYDDLWD